MNAIPAERLQRELQTLLEAYGCDHGESPAIAENLVWNQCFDRPDHGLGRLAVLLGRLERGQISSPCRAALERKSPALALLEGGNGFGQYLGARAMDTAIAIAREQGLGAVGLRGSNWNGSGACYVERAARAGLIGFCTSNVIAKVVPAGGELPVFGTNPLAFGTPRADGRSILIDLATSEHSGAQTRRAAQNSGQSSAQIPPLQPLGGAKGTALALMVELLSAVLPGARLSSELSSMFAPLGSGGHGQFFLALDIRRWLPLDAYYARVEQLAELIRASGAEARLPGERGWHAYARQSLTGVELAPALLSELNALARARDLPEFIPAQTGMPVDTHASAASAEKHISAASAEKHASASAQELAGAPAAASSLASGPGSGFVPGPGFRIRRRIERPDPALLERLRAFTSPDISDQLNGCYSYGGLQPLVGDGEILIGPACTVRLPPGDNLMLHKALELAAPGDVLVVAAAEASAAVCGEMICRKAVHRGIAGLVIDGLARDLPGMQAAGLPVYARGLSPQGPTKRGPGEINYPIGLGGLAIAPGDVIVADSSGLVVIPQAELGPLLARLEAGAGALARYSAEVAAGSFDLSWTDALLRNVTYDDVGDIANDKAGDPA